MFLASCTNPFDTSTSALVNDGSQQQVADQTITSAHVVAAKSDERGAKIEQTTSARLVKVQQIMKGMTLDQKLGQLLMVEYIGTGYVSPLPAMISTQFVGGYVYQPANYNFDAPYNTPDMAAKVTMQAEADAKIPLLVAVDQEGGKVQKLSPLFGTTPSAEEMALSGDSAGVTAQGKQDAQWMAQVGINTDLAPVVDVGSDTNLMTSRMFGSDPQIVSTYAGAFLDGLQQNGIIGTLKHFPGLGTLPAGADPHIILPYSQRSVADLDQIDWAPYEALIQQHNPAMIMTTDIIYNAIDPVLAAELSPKTVTGILRQQLGYNGVIITDGLYMHGVNDHWPLPEASVLAIEAGNDMVEGPFGVDQVAQVVSAFKEALANGDLTQERIDQSVQRILLMKTQYGLIK